MQVDFIIVGQGICGTLLSYNLLKHRKTCLVIDNQKSLTASRISAGIINPVTGRRYAHSWMIDDVMPFAVGVYRDLEKELNLSLIHDTSIIDFFPSPQMRNAFLERLEEGSRYLHSFPEQNNFNGYLNYPFGCGEIKPVYSVNINFLLKHWTKKLEELGCFREEEFHPGELVVEDGGVRYQDVQASRVIFCDGADANNSEWFRLLPFAPNKGEALLVECTELQRKHIFKKGLMLTPFGNENLFWVGSNYQWEFDNDKPSQTFLDQTTALLKNWVRLPFQIVDHLSAIRPATIERRPFIGFHPQQEAIGIFNGMGTKGVSLAPFFANNLVEHLVNQEALHPEADIRRFARILSR